MKAQNSTAQKTNTIVSTTMIIVGVLLLIYMVTVEGEFGALPLILIVAGIVWFFVTRDKMTRQRK